MILSLKPLKTQLPWMESNHRVLNQNQTFYH